MINKRPVYFVMMFFIGIFLINNSIILAQDKNQGNKYFWHDLDQKQEIYLQKDLLASFSSADEIATKNSKVNKVIREFSGVKILKVSPQLFKMGIQGKKNLGKISPVFSPTQKGSSIMALPGGVIVHFEEKKTEAEIAKWAEKNKVKIKRGMPQVGKNIWFVDSAPGLHSLEMANKFHKQGEVLSATPNWWRPLFLR